MSKGVKRLWRGEGGGLVLGVNFFSRVQYGYFLFNMGVPLLNPLPLVDTINGILY